MKSIFWAIVIVGGISSTTFPEIIKTNEINNDWDLLLSQHVSDDGHVDYKSLKAKEDVLDAYLADLVTTPEDFNKNAGLAFWINMYNAHTVKLILENYPISSIMKIDNGKVWDRKWIKYHDKTLSLNQIEHEIIRPTYKDARIHFAVNCAARSCPPLWNRAWTAQNVQSQLESATKKFINNQKMNKLSVSKIRISRIFEWYKEDFGDLRDFVAKYYDGDINKDATIKFLEYDWKLNGK